MRDREPQRLAPQRRIRDARVGELTCQRLVGEPRRPDLDGAVGRRALGAQLDEIRVQLVGERLHGERVAGEAPQPHPVAEQEVVERAVDRFEESARVAFAFGVRERRAVLKKALVHPAAVRRQRSGVGGREHGCRISREAGGAIGVGRVLGPKCRLFRTKPGVGFDRFVRSAPKTSRQLRLSKHFPHAAGLRLTAGRGRALFKLARRAYRCMRFGRKARTTWRAHTARARAELANAGEPCI